MPCHSARECLYRCFVGAQLGDRVGGKGFLRAGIAKVLRGSTESTERD